MDTVLPTIDEIETTQCNIDEIDVAQSERDQYKEGLMRFHQEVARLTERGIKGYFDNDEDTSN